MNGVFIFTSYLLVAWHGGVAREAFKEGRESDGWFAVGQVIAGSLVMILAIGSELGP